MNPPKVSVIIPAYNCEKTIAAAVNGCLAQRYPHVEVVVVDDGSSDATAAILGTFKRIRWIKQLNKGPACARNAGAKIASGQFLAFTDSDCVAHEDWLEKLMACFAQENVGAVAGSYGITNTESILARCIQAEIEYRHRRFSAENIRALGSYNFAIRREIFDRIKGFDESYRRASGEDNDLSYRILALERRIAFAKDALVDHTHPRSLRQYLREQFRHGFWRAKLYVDHPRMAAGDDYTFWKDAWETLASAVFLLWAVVAVLVPGLRLFLVPFALLFYFFEFICCIFLRLPLVGTFYYAWAMTLRSFARTLGLATGIARFIFAFKTKKT
jgi:glycosyltransferase involved in cell wall biosynthesis